MTMWPAVQIHNPSEPKEIDCSSSTMRSRRTATLRIGDVRWRKFEESNPGALSTPKDFQLICSSTRFCQLPSAQHRHESPLLTGGQDHQSSIGKCSGGIQLWPLLGNKLHVYRLPGETLCVSPENILGLTPILPCDDTETSLCRILYGVSEYAYDTVLPIKRIAASRHDSEKASDAVQRFKTGKDHELKFVKVASTLSAAAAVGSLSWPSITETPWSALALFYSSLLFAIFALIGAAQHSALLNTIFVNREIGSHSQLTLTLFLSKARPESTEKTAQSSDERARHASDDQHGDTIISWNMVFVWQFPLMLMRWSWVAFVVVMALHVWKPLFPGLGAPDHYKVAVFFLAVCATVCLVFAWCSFWGYRAAKISTSCHTLVEAVGTSPVPAVSIDIDGSGAGHVFCTETV
ncbi:hypothetical protein PV04_09318 [Phialophora macrospora]|uniref:Uncharacterized protein n=1 Tax=Phialophora macrospora TaxID=1851006 RepID=A0A0D2FWP3_9EURO|nr:hypothetical protein PV04_09318 [Phialophora macrospora]